MTASKWRTAVVAILAISIVDLGLVGTAQAGIASTSALVQAERDVDLASIRSRLAGSEVRAQLEKMGVDPAAIDARVAALSDSELQLMARQMQKAPAGGDGVLAVIGLVFVVLMILEFTGVIDIFKRA
jgi:hypothetical protein